MVTEKIISINHQIRKISRALDDVSAYSPYIYFKIGKGVIEKNGEEYTLEFNTLSGLGLNDYGNKSNQINYILQADVKKIGLNCGNTFKIRLAFVADYAGKENESLLDKLERNNLVFKQFDESILFQQFELRYGYCFPQGESYVKTNLDQYILSPTYRGLIINYTMEILNGYVMYELECVSGICTLNEITLDMSSHDLFKIAGYTYNPVKLVKGILKKYIDDNKLKYTIVDYINGENGCGCENDGGDTGEHPIFDAGVHGEHIFDYVRKVLSQSRAKGQWNCEKRTPQTEESQVKKWEDAGKTVIDESEFIEFYFLPEDDVSNGENPRFVFDYKPKNNKNPIKDDELSFNFEWLKGGKKGLVINFLPEFNGTTFFALMGGTIGKVNRTINRIYEARHYNYVINGNGEFEENVTYESGTDAYSSDEEYFNDYVDKNGGMYNQSGFESGLTLERAIELFGTRASLNSSTQSATIQLVGIPSDIPLLTKIRITPIVNNVKHFTAGMYQIIGIEDQISSSGFMTTLKLFRSPEDDNFKDMFELYLENSEYKDKFSKEEIEHAIKNDSLYNFKVDIYDVSDNSIYDTFVWGTEQN